MSRWSAVQRRATLIACAGHAGSPSWSAFAFQIPAASGRGRPRQTRPPRPASCRGTRADAVVDLVAAGTDARTDRGHQIRRRDSQVRDRLDSGRRDAGGGSAPAGVHGRDHAAVTIGDQNRHAVGDAHSDGARRIGRDDRVGFSVRDVRRRQPGRTTSTARPCTWLTRTTSPAAHPERLPDAAKIVVDRRAAKRESRVVKTDARRIGCESAACCQTPARAVLSAHSKRGTAVVMSCGPSLVRLKLAGVIRAVARRHASRSGTARQLPVVVPQLRGRAAAVARDVWRRACS